ncbi:MAG: hypothetical protein EAZ11_08955 [Curvibacter sp.]|nr:MAG: hypothetical protein EAZ11_08955 [Curvibacter sp.]
MNFLRSAGLLVVCLTLQSAGAQTDASAQAQRERIAAERGLAEAKFQQEEQACHNRFAVQACVDQITSQRRALERGLKAQEAALNATDRSLRAQEQLQRIAAKEREHQERTAEQAGHVAADRLQVQQEKQQKHRNAAQAPVNNAASRPSPSAPTDAEKALQRKAHAEKLQAAQERRKERDKRLRESTEKSPALPIPN